MYQHGHEKYLRVSQPHSQHISWLEEHIKKLLNDKQEVEGAAIKRSNEEFVPFYQQVLLNWWIPRLNNPVDSECVWVLFQEAGIETNGL